MAFKEKPILTCCIFIRLSFITVSGFAVFHEGKRFDSAGYFNKNAQTIESFDRGDQKPKSGAQVGRLLIWQDQASKSHGGGSVRFSSDFSSSNQPDENANQSEDSGWMKLQHLWEQVYGLNTLYTPTVERLLGMKPKVDCVGDLMKLTVHGREAPFGSNLLIDRGSIPPLPLVQLPSECGHIFLRTWRDFVFTIPYNGCYVSQERDTFVLPLLWWGLPVKMSCSSMTSTESEPMVSCYSNGMIVRLNSRGVSENLKIKGMNEWQPLLEVSARCGYSLVSHPEGVVIHAPYMPCMEPKDGMFTLSMAIESEFNLSCPALSLSLPISAPDLVHENELISVPHALTSTTLPPTTISTTTKMTPPKRAPTTSSTTSTSSIQKLASPPFPHYIPGQPVPPSYPFLLFPPNIPQILPPGRKIVGPPTAITKRPQAQVYTKLPQTWYPWYPKPSLGLTHDTSHQSAAGSHYPRKPLMAPITPLLKPTGNPQDQLTFTTPIVPPLQWVPMYPPSNMMHPLYPGKPEFVSTSSAVFPQVPYRSHHSQNIQRPSEPHSPPKPEFKTRIPAPTRKTGPQLLQSLWFKPFPPHRSEMPPVPTKVLRSKTISSYGAVTSSSTTYSEESEQALKPKAFVLPYKSDVKGPPMNFQLALSPSTNSTPSLPKLQVVHTHTPIKAPSTLISSSHACSFHCPTFCSGPPSIFYHHHNHHHFGHPFQMSNLDISSVTKFKGQTLSSAFKSPGSNLLSLIQAMGYNYGPLSSQHTAVPPASDYTAMQYLVENPLSKDTDAPGTSKYLTKSTMSPYIFRKLESTAPPPRSTMKPANVAPVIHPVGPSKLHSRLLQNRPVAEPLDYSDQSLDPAVNQPEIKRYFSPWGHDTQPMLVAPNNVPSFEEMVQHDISSKPTMLPTHGKNVFMNYWYQASNSNAKPSMSNFPTKDSFTQMLLPPLSNNQIKSSNRSPQPEQSHGKTSPLQQNFQPLMQFHNSVPVIRPELHFPPNGESVVPAIRRPRLFETHWVPAVQSKKDSGRAGNGANLQ
ncbi:mucin-2-like [Carassius carassius]|uniref:mucin-2-like n=1 Tax=Carassius carassius TaxID=217509 RepID=UPI002868587F|nr:mucin-2-like [Carassius carassius]